MIAHILIIALFTLGYCCTFWEGMIFERIGDFMECNFPEWLWKPLGGCYICACMWIGSGVYVVLWGTSWLDWFITCVGAMGINAAVSVLQPAKQDHVEPKEERSIKITINTNND